jgi:hypothetical protein
MHAFGPIPKTIINTAGEANNLDFIRFDMLLSVFIEFADTIENAVIAVS